jgi:hypothetical protein
VRPLPLPGWSRRSRWGYDPRLECYWAVLWPAPGGPVDRDTPVEISSRHLITTVDGMARTLARVAAVSAPQAYLALTA